MRARSERWCARRPARGPSEVVHACTARRAPLQHEARRLARSSWPTKSILTIRSGGVPKLKTDLLKAASTWPVDLVGCAQCSVVCTGQRRAGLRSSCRDARTAELAEVPGGGLRPQRPLRPEAARACRRAAPHCCAVPCLLSASACFRAPPNGEGGVRAPKRERPQGPRASARAGAVPCPCPLWQFLRVNHRGPAGRLPAWSSRRLSEP